MQLAEQAAVECTRASAEAKPTQSRLSLSRSISVHMHPVFHLSKGVEFKCNFFLMGWGGEGESRSVIYQMVWGLLSPTEITDCKQTVHAATTLVIVYTTVCL